MWGKVLQLNYRLEDCMEKSSFVVLPLEAMKMVDEVCLRFADVIVGCWMSILCSPLHSRYLYRFGIESLRFLPVALPLFGTPTSQLLRCCGIASKLQEACHSLIFQSKGEEEQQELWRLSKRLLSLTRENI